MSNGFNLNWGNDPFNLNFQNQPQSPISTTSTPTDSNFLKDTLGMDFSTLGGWGNALFGGKDQPGLLSLGMDLYSAFKQYGLMEDQLDLQKDKFESDRALANRNLANQAQLLNTAMEDRQRARLSSGGNYESLASYMDRNRVDGSPV